MLMNKIKSNIFIQCLQCFIFCLLIFPLPVAADTDPLLTGNYYGTATITSPASLGVIDLSFRLEVAGSSIQHDASYIDLGKTLLFPVVLPQIGGKDVGPRVSGSFTPTAFSLMTDSFPATVSGKVVTRQIALSNATVSNNGATITGTFTETVTGLTKNIVTVTGDFVLVRPVVMGLAAISDADGSQCLDLNEIKAGGADPNVLEFSDVSYALHLYNNPSIQPNICIPAASIIQQILADYYKTLP